MKVVFAPDGSRGDIQPMIAWAARLVREGHEVALCAAPGFREEAEAVGAVFHAYSFDFERAFAENNERVIAGGRAAQSALDEMWAGAAQSQFRLLPSVAAGADVVIGAGPALASTSVAEAVGARHYAVAYVPTLLPSAHHAPITLHAPWMPRIGNRALWRAVRLYYNFKLLPALNRGRRELGLRPARDGFGLVLGKRVIAAFDPELATLPPDVGVSVSHVGYLHGSETPALSDEVEAFLHAGPAPLYVGFGSMTDTDPDATTVLIAEAAERAGVRVIVAGGWAKLGGNLRSDRVLAVAQVPHASLFPRCAGAVHHGGAGTTATAARAGVPQLLIPHLLDQRYWASRVAALALGPPAILRPKLRLSSLARGFRSLLERASYRANARALGQRLRERDAVGRASAVIAD